MSTIEFPHTSDDYLRIGMNYYNEENFEQAIKYFTQAYLINNKLSSHRLIINSYQELGEYSEALDIFLENQQNYLKTSDGKELYYNLLCQNHEWLKVNIFIIENNLSNKIDELKGLEKSDLLYRREEIKKIESEIKNINNLNNIDLWKEAQKIPLDHYLDLVYPQLINPNLSLVIRSDLLMNLCYLEIEHPIQYLNYQDEIITVIPKNIHIDQNNKYCDQIINLLYTKLNDNPILLDSMEKYILFILECLFPDAKSVINDNLQEFIISVIDQLNMVEKTSPSKFKYLIDKIQNEILKLT